TKVYFLVIKIHIIYIAVIKIYCVYFYHFIFFCIPSPKFNLAHYLPPPNNPHRFCEYCICFCCIYCTKYRFLFRCCIRIVFINRPHALWFCALCVDVARFDSYYFVHYPDTSILVISLITSSASTTSETVEKNESNVRLSCSAKR